MLKIFDEERSSYIFFTYWLNHGCEVGEKIFNSIKFFNSNSTRSSNKTPTLAHIKKESNSVLQYAAPATPTQQYSYKQVCGVEGSESHVLEQSRSTFFRFDKVGVAKRSQFFRFSGVANQSPYCF